MVSFLKRIRGAKHPQDHSEGELAMSAQWMRATAGWRRGARRLGFGRLCRTVAGCMHQVPVVGRGAASRAGPAPIGPPGAPCKRRPTVQNVPTGRTSRGAGARERPLSLRGAPSRVWAPSAAPSVACGLALGARTRCMGDMRCGHSVTEKLTCVHEQKHNGAC